MKKFEPTSRSTVRRLPNRAVYDVAAVHQILDEGLVCHVGFVSKHQPFVIPMAYGRKGDHLYLHGSAASRVLQTLQRELEICVTVVLLDGLVLARSAFHHSMNYRSAMLFGRSRLVDDPEEKMAGLKAIVDHVTPGRWDEVRPPSQRELGLTSVLVLPIDEASAKVRVGPPIDDPEDYGLPVWAGVIPVRLTCLPPTPDPRLNPGIPTPSSVLHYSRQARPREEEA